QIPELQTARVAPLNPFAISRCLPVLFNRQPLARLLTKRARAIFAIANTASPQTAPTIVSETLRPITFHYLAHDLRKVFVVIRAVDAGDKLVARAEGLAGCVHRKPVGMGTVELLVRPVGIHAR